MSTCYFFLGACGVQDTHQGYYRLSRLVMQDRIFICKCIIKVNYNTFAFKERSLVAKLTLDNMDTTGADKTQIAPVVSWVHVVSGLSEVPVVSWASVISSFSDGYCSWGFYGVWMLVLYQACLLYYI